MSETGITLHVAAKLAAEGRFEDAVFMDIYSRFVIGSITSYNIDKLSEDSRLAMR